MSKSMAKRKIIAGLIAGIVSIALLLGMEAIERKAPVPVSEEPAAQSGEEAAPAPAPAEPASASVSADTAGEFQAGTYTGTAKATLTEGEYVEATGLKLIVSTP